MLVMMSPSRSRGTSEGIDRLCLGAWPNVRPQAVASRDVDLSPQYFFEIGRDAGIREEVGGDLRREVDEQVHVTVRSVLRANDRPEHGDVNDAPRTEFHFMGAKPREDVREEGHIE